MRESASKGAVKLIRHAEHWGYKPVVRHGSLKKPGGLQRSGVKYMRARANQSSATAGTLWLTHHKCVRTVVCGD